MAHTTSDGEPFTNKMSANRHQSTLDSRPRAAVAQPTDSPAPQSIEQDPEAMQAVDLLKQKGYTADDVAQAMGDDQGQSMDSGAPPQAAPVNIPGLG